MFPVHALPCTGTLEYLGRVQELITIMRDCRNILKFHRPDDSRLETARAIVGEFRICTQYMADMWPSRADWLKSSSVDVAKKLFLAPETLHALHCTIEGFIGTRGNAEEGHALLNIRDRNVYIGRCVHACRLHSAVEGGPTPCHILGRDWRRLGDTGTHPLASPNCMNSPSCANAASSTASNNRLCRIPWRSCSPE